MLCNYRYDLCICHLCNCSAIIEHTNHVIYLEDNDVAAVSDGMLTIHRLSSGDGPDEKAVREVLVLKMQIQQIMKGKFSKKVNKEIRKLTL